MNARRSAVVLTALFLGMAGAVTEAAAEVEGNALISVPLFSRRTPSDDEIWRHVQSHHLLGVTIDFGGERWPLHIALGFYASTDSADMTSRYGSVTELRANFFEASLGVQRDWRVGSFRPFVGGGIVTLSAERAFEEKKVYDVEDTVNDTAVYLQAGGFFRPGARLALGVSVRWVLGTDVAYSFPADVEGDADYVQWGLLLGWGWPRQDR